MRQPAKRTLKVKYNPNPKAERYVIKAICKVLDAQRGSGRRHSDKENQT